VAPSHWLAECVLTSSLLSCRRVEVIPNGVDASIYCPGDRLAARSALGLTTKRQLILFGANHALSDRNKGFDLLQNALSKLSPRQVAQTELVLFGDDTALPFSCTMPVRNLGVVRDEARIVQLYQAADIFVIPSRQENLPNMILEAMACGIPCVAFSVGGIPDLITHGVDGYLATPGDSGDLSRGIACLLEDDSRREMIAARARRKVETKFTLQHSVERYLTLYRELMAE